LQRNFKAGSRKDSIKKDFEEDERDISSGEKGNNLHGVI